MWVFAEFAAAKPIAERWLAAAPESPFARTAMGMVLTHAGWDARGGALIRTRRPHRSMRWIASSRRPFRISRRRSRRNRSCCLPVTRWRPSGGCLRLNCKRVRSRIASSTTIASWWIVQEMALDAEPRWGGSLEAMRFTDAYAQARVARNATLAPLTVKQAGYEAARSNDRKQHLEVLKRAGPAGTECAVHQGRGHRVDGLERSLGRVRVVVPGAAIPAR